MDISSSMSISELIAMKGVETVRDEFPAIVGDPGKDYIFADAPTGTQVDYKATNSNPYLLN